MLSGGQRHMLFTRRPCSPATRDCRCERNRGVGCPGLSKRCPGSRAASIFCAICLGLDLSGLPYFRSLGSWSGLFAASCAVSPGCAETATWRDGGPLTQPSASFYSRMSPRSGRASQLVPFSASEHCGHHRSLCARPALGSADCRRPDLFDGQRSCRRRRLSRCDLARAG